MKNKIKKISKINLIITLGILCISGYTMAKAIEEITLKGQAEIAEPIFEVEHEEKIDITTPNDNNIYTFKIKNYNEKNKINQIDLNYNIEILGNIDKSIEFELYENNKQIELNENKSIALTLENNKKSEKEYKIKIKYKSENETNTNDLIEKIKIKINTIEKNDNNTNQ